MRRAAQIAFFLWMAKTPSVQAHEFWFVPVRSPQHVGDLVPLRLEVGEFFEGDPAGLSISRTAQMRHFTASVQTDLKPFLSPDEPEAEVLFSLDRLGTHVIAYDSEPLQITLSADRFHAYLHDEGLDFIKSKREENSTALLPGRERYRRNVKTLFVVGAANSKDRTFGISTGQRLELVPAQNPAAMRPGDALALSVTFDGNPLGGALVKAWHKHNGQLLIIRTQTSAMGRVTINLPFPGEWMLSVVHMVAATDSTDIDWESYWGNLSFYLPDGILAAEVLKHNAPSTRPFSRGRKNRGD
jgi:uncharacterized GH25 family protein